MLFKFNAQNQARNVLAMNVQFFALFRNKQLNAVQMYKTVIAKWRN